jgi:hypothetical protein
MTTKRVTVTADQDNVMHCPHCGSTEFYIITSRSQQRQLPCMSVSFRREGKSTKKPPGDRRRDAVRRMTGAAISQSADCASSRPTAVSALGGPRHDISVRLGTMPRRGGMDQSLSK